MGGGYRPFTWIMAWIWVARLAASGRPGSHQETTLPMSSYGRADGCGVQGKADGRGGDPDACSRLASLQRRRQDHCLVWDSRKEGCRLLAAISDNDVER